MNKNVFIVSRCTKFCACNFVKKSKKDKAMRNDSAGVTGRTLDMKLCDEGVREVV